MSDSSSQIDKPRKWPTVVNNVLASNDEETKKKTAPRRGKTVRLKKKVRVSVCLSVRRQYSALIFLGLNVLSVRNKKKDVCQCMCHLAACIRSRVSHRAAAGLAAHVNGLIDRNYRIGPFLIGRIDGKTRVTALSTRPRRIHD